MIAITWRRKLAALAPGERRLLLAAAALVPLVRLALVLLPFRVVIRTLRSATPRAGTPHAASRIAWAVRAAARRVPLGGNCLAQAVAACLLLRRHGHEATLRVGVARDGGRLTAHAWVESDGRVLVGAPEHQRYVPLAGWEARA